MLNVGGADAHPERLVHLARTYGVSTFVLAGDDPRARPDAAAGYAACQAASRQPLPLSATQITGVFDRWTQQWSDQTPAERIARAVGWFATVTRSFQTGYIYHYAFTMIIGLFALLTWWVVR